MSINPLELFFKRKIRDIQRRLEGYTDTELVEQIKRLLESRGITTITEQEIFDRLKTIPDAVSKQIGVIVQEFIMDNLEEIRDSVALETSITALKNVTGYVKTAVEALQSYDEELHEFNPIVVFEDDVAFWTLVESGEGSIGGTKSEEKENIASGKSCVKVVVGAGTKLEVFLRHIYGTVQDWSSKKHIPVWVYGQNTGYNNELWILDSANNYSRWYLLDDYTGWRRFEPELRNPDVKSGTVDLTDIKQIRYDPISGLYEGTFYLDRIVVDNLKTRLEGTIAKLVNVKDGQDDMRALLTEGVVVSDNLRVSDDDEKTSAATSATKIKEIKVYRSGIHRIKFDLAMQSGDGTAKGQLFKNEEGHGTERTNATTTYQTFSEDLYYAKDDLIQLYVYVANPVDTPMLKVRNLRVYCDLSYEPVYGDVH